MRLKTAAAMVAIALLFGKSASAHRIDEYLQATILSLQVDRVQASMRLVPGVLVAPSVIAEIDANGDGVLTEDEELAYAQRVVNDLSITIDGKRVQPKLISWNFPLLAEMREGIAEIQIDYTADLPRGGPNRTLILANHHLGRSSVYLMNAVVPRDPSLQILAQKRNEQQSLYELDYRQMPAIDARSNVAWRDFRAFVNGIQFRSLFRLGMRHIAEGTDHLLFLLALLLPAPLLVAGSRWGPPAALHQSLLRILGIVSAFTLGHSITLSLAALGFVHIPERPVEVLIAVSILISAAHAFRPIFPGRETWIASFFGLIHGLAFAATLNRLGLGHWERVAGILAFNLGIETMQILVVAAILPSLLLMSRTRVYPFVRIAGALFAGVASAGWMVQRLSDVETSVNPIMNAFARHALWIVIAGFLVSLALRFLPPFVPGDWLTWRADLARRTDPQEMASSRVRP